MIELIDNKPAPADVIAECLSGLRATPKQLPCKYFYDAEGSALFEQITELEEYYPTRTELSIFEAHGDAIAKAIGPNAVLVELGSGSGMKTIELLRRMESPRGIAMVEISRAALEAAAKDLEKTFPDLPIWGVCADYTQHVTLPELGGARRVAFFPGSTIGNFGHDDARGFLSRVRSLVEPDGGFLLGFDRRKDRAVMEAAYNDSQGVTAAFNLNVLAHLNRAGANFDLEGFRHEAPFDADHSRIEMRLVSLRDQEATVGGETIAFAEGEPIVTEHCHKYTLEQMEALAGEAGLRIATHWSDPKDWFSVAYLVP